MPSKALQYRHKTWWWAVCFISACVTITPPADVKHKARAFALQGRVVVVTKQKTVTGTLRWQHTADSDHLLWYSPFGERLAQIDQTAQGATLQLAQKTAMTSSRVETLSQRVWGWILPLASMTDWVLGQADRSVASHFVYHEGHLSQFRQKDWQIRYVSYKLYGEYFLPQHMIWIHPDVTLKLYIHQLELL